MSGTVIDSMEKVHLTGIQDFISSLVNDRYLWPGDFLDHLMDVVASIASHGNAIIDKRGANFLIPKKKRLSIRVAAPKSGHLCVIPSLVCPPLFWPNDPPV
jgi:cytidylate kinase